MTETDSRNGVDVAALEATVDAVRNQRSLGEVTFSVNGDWNGGFRLRATSGALVQAGSPDAERRGRFVIESDEPSALLGSDTAASPGEYILHALAGCYTVTLAANAAARGIELESYRLEMEADFDLAGFLGIDPEVNPGAQEIRAALTLKAPGTSRAELEELVRVVESRSPIRDTLTRSVVVKTELVD